MSQITQRYKATQVFAAECGPIYTASPILRAPTVAHDHDFFEIAFVRSGEGLHLSAHGEQRAARGDGWILAPGAWHAYRECRELEVCNCCFGGELLERELAALRYDVGANHLFFEGPLASEKHGMLAFHVEDTRRAQFFETFRGARRTGAHRAFAVVFGFARRQFGGHASRRATHQNPTRRCARRRNFWTRN